MSGPGISPLPDAMSDRAAVALLTLRLRTAEKELLDARAAEAAIDVETARAQLRAKLAPLEDARRVSLAAALDEAERDAAASIAAARAQSMPAPIPDAEVLIPEVVARAEVHTPPPAEREPIVLTQPEAVVVTESPVVEAPAAESASAAATPQTPAAPAAAPAVIAPQIVFDTEAFARVFATVIAETIEKTRSEMRSELQQHYPQQIVPPVQYSPGVPGMPGMPGVTPYGQYPMYYPAPPKAGFWSHAKHPDVVLLGIATVIVLVILVAWLS